MKLFLISGFQDIRIGCMYFFEPKRCSDSNKIMYADKIRALQAASDCLRERGTRLWVYKCNYCSTWHLTSSPPIESGLGGLFSEEGEGKSGRGGYRRLGSKTGGAVGKSSGKIRSRKRAYKPRRK